MYLKKSNGFKDKVYNLLQCSVTNKNINNIKYYLCINFILFLFN